MAKQGYMQGRQEDAEADVAPWLRMGAPANLGAPPCPRCGGNGIGCGCRKSAEEAEMSGASMGAVRLIAEVVSGPAAGHVHEAIAILSGDGPEATVSVILYPAAGHMHLAHARLADLRAARGVLISTRDGAGPHSHTVRLRIS